MIALQVLNRQNQSGSMSPVPDGAAFWAQTKQAAILVQAGQAAYAPTGTPEPHMDPPKTVHGQPGYATGTTNSSLLGGPDCRPRPC
jgi:hypothetical protein